MLSKRKILYVDDEEINLKLFEISLRNFFDVLTASTAIEGLEILKKDSGINVVISDLKMPEMNGLDFITHIKEEKKDTICMLLSGYIESEILMEGFNRKYLFRYILKPWDKEKLISTIEEAFLQFTG